MQLIINIPDIEYRLLKRFGDIDAPKTKAFAMAIINGTELPSNEAIPKADYEQRLKADMVAILTEIQLEIEELQGKYSPNYDEASQHASEIIQEKINALRGNSNE